MTPQQKQDIREELTNIYFGKDDVGIPNHFSESQIDYILSLLDRELERAKKQGYDKGRESRQGEVDFLRNEAYGDKP